MAAAVASATSGSSAHVRRQQEERLLRGVAVDQQQRALAEVVQQQRRQHQREPRDADRPLAEVPHVGVQRFAAGDREEHGAEHGEAVPAVRVEEPNGVTRIDRRRARSAACTIQSMPSTAMVTNQTTMTGPNRRPTRCVPYCWIDEDADRGSPTAIGTTYGSNSGVATLRPSTAPSTRDRRRDHAVAVEQRRAEDAEQRRATDGAMPSPARRRRQQRRQREDAAFALVVGAHHDRDVLDRDDDAGASR